MDTTDIKMIASLAVIIVFMMIGYLYLQKKGYSKTKTSVIPATSGTILMGIAIWILLKLPFLEGIVVVVITGGIGLVTSFLRSVTMQWLQDKIHRKNSR